MRLLITTQTMDKNDPILGFFHAWVLEFAQHFDRIDVICLKEGVHELPDNVSVHSLGKEHGEDRFKYALRFYRYFWQIYMRGGVDYVFFHMGAIYNIMAAPFFVVRKLTHTKFYWWKTHGLLNMMGKLALLFVDEVVTAGAQSFASNTKKVRVVGHAINTELFSPQKPPETSTRALMVGRITPIKKCELMIPVVASVRADGILLTLDLIGTTNESEYIAMLEKMIDAQDLREHVRFAGTRTQVELVDEYRHVALLLHPAYEAGFDKVVLEAMATGVLPLTSIPSFRPILEPFGLHIAPEDTNGYVTRIKELLGMPQDERTALGARLRDIVVREHSLGTLTERVFGIV